MGYPQTPFCILFEIKVPLTCIPIMVLVHMLYQESLREGIPKCIGGAVMGSCGVGEGAFNPCGNNCAFIIFLILILLVLGSGNFFGG